MVAAGCYVYNRPGRIHGVGQLQVAVLTPIVTWLQVQSILECADADGDGVLEFDEFVELMSTHGDLPKDSKVSRGCRSCTG